MYLPPRSDVHAVEKSKDNGQLCQQDRQSQLSSLHRGTTSGSIFIMKKKIIVRQNPRSKGLGDERKRKRGKVSFFGSRP